MHILAARKYPTPRNGPLSIVETETHRLAYAIKTIASPCADFDTAAREMAALILDHHSQLSTFNPHLSLWLVPIPDSNGNTDANTRLASHIARYVTLSVRSASPPPLWGEGLRVRCSGEVALTQLSTLNHQPFCCQVVKAIHRTHPIQSQCTRHKHALGPIPPDQHHFARTRKALTLRQTYFVDNVTTSGHTMQAARAALGFGAGLVFADAASRKTQIQATLF